MFREVIAAPRPGLDLNRHYGHHQSPAIRAGGLIFCSGMPPIDAETGDRMHGTLTSEAHCIFRNLQLLLESAGSSLASLVQVHALIYDSIEYDVLNRVYRQYVGDGPPARTVWTAQSEAGFKIQLDAVAVAPSHEPSIRSERDVATLNRIVVSPPLATLDIAKSLNQPASTTVRGGPFLFFSGLCAVDPETGQRLHGTTVSETRLILTNLQRLLEAAGSSMQNVVKINVLLHSMLEAGPMNDVYAKFFPDPPPARTVCGARLPDGCKVIIECTALA